MDLRGASESMSTNADYKLEPLGDCGLLIKLEGGMDEAALAKVTAVTERLESRLRWEGFIECVPAYASVALYYNPYIVSLNRETKEESDESVYVTVCNRVRNVLAEVRFDGAGLRETRVVRIPVCYGGELGPDLVDVATHAGMGAGDVVELHSGVGYTVHMIGFAPGFPYLGGMPEAITAPRRRSPRLLIPAGSVGIAGGQTGVYPIATPGGWQIIGRTPLALFRPDHRRPSLLQSGDRVQFVPITRVQFDDWPRDADINGCSC